MGHKFFSHPPLSVKRIRKSGAKKPTHFVLKKQIVSIKRSLKLEVLFNQGVKNNLTEWLFFAEHNGYSDCTIWSILRLQQVRWRFAVQWIVPLCLTLKKKPVTANTRHQNEKKKKKTVRSVILSKGWCSLQLKTYLCETISLKVEAVDYLTVQTIRNFVY